MKTYIYKEEYKAPGDKTFDRGSNVRIVVYRMKNNQPKFVGYSEHNTASWRGPAAQASHIIASKDGHKITDGYTLDSKNIRVFGV